MTSYLEEEYGRSHRLSVEEQRAIPYREYLRTPEWRNRRIKALDYANQMCEKCGSEDRLQVHHLTYENRGAEPPQDLIVLCRPCHKETHGL